MRERNSTSSKEHQLLLFVQVPVPCNLGFLGGSIGPKPRAIRKRGKRAREPHRHPDRSTAQPAPAPPRSHPRHVPDRRARRCCVNGPAPRAQPPALCPLPDQVPSSVGDVQEARGAGPAHPPPAAARIHMPCTHHARMAVAARLCLPSSGLPAAGSCVAARPVRACGARGGGAHAVPGGVVARDAPATSGAADHRLMPMPWRPGWAGKLLDGGGG
jgi:hypothetical protein